MYHAPSGRCWSCLSITYLQLLVNVIVFSIFLRLPKLASICTSSLALDIVTIGEKCQRYFYFPKLMLVLLFVCVPCSFRTFAIMTLRNFFASLALSKCSIFSISPNHWTAKHLTKLVSTIHCNYWWNNQRYIYIQNIILVLFFVCAPCPFRPLRSSLSITFLPL